MTEPCRIASLALVALLAGCGQSPPSQVVVVFDVDPAVAEEARELRVVICDQLGVVRLDRTVEVTASTFPAKVPVSPEGGDRTRLFVVSGALSGASGELLQVQRAIAGFPSRGRTEVARRFDPSCQGVLECSGLETCSAGSCVEARSPGLELPDEVADALASCGLATADGDADADVDEDAEIEPDAEPDAGTDADLPPCTARNLVLNPGFEADSDGWILNNAGAAVVTGGADGSGHAVRISADTGSHSASQSVEGVVGGQVYTFEVWSRVADIVAEGPYQPQVSLVWLGGSGLQVGETRYLYAGQGTSGWRRISASPTAPADAVGARLTAFTWSAITAGAVYFDDVCLAGVGD